MVPRAPFHLDKYFMVVLAPKFRRSTQLWHFLLWPAWWPSYRHWITPVWIVAKAYKHHPRQRSQHRCMECYCLSRSALYSLLHSGTLPHNQRAQIHLYFRCWYGSKFEGDASLRSWYIDEGSTNCDCWSWGSHCYPLVVPTAKYRLNRSAFFRWSGRTKNETKTLAVPSCHGMAIG